MSGFARYGIKDFLRVGAERPRKPQRQATPGHCRTDFDTAQVPGVDTHTVGELLGSPAERESHRSDLA